MNDLINLKSVNNKNYQNIKNMTFGNKQRLNDTYFYSTFNNKTEFIKKILLTKQGVDFIKNLNETQNKELWTFIVENNDIKLLKQLNTTGIEMSLSNEELYSIMFAFDSVEFLGIFEFLLSYFELDEVCANNLLYGVLIDLRTPNTRKQQQIQFNIIQRIIKDYPNVKNVLKESFYDVLQSLNIPLIDFFMKEFGITIDEEFDNKTCLQNAVFYLFNNPNQNIQFVFEMVDYLLTKGADVKQRNEYDQDIYFYIDEIADKNVQNILIKKLSKYQSSIIY